MAMELRQDEECLQASVNGNAENAIVYTSADGKYIDADYNIGIIRVKLENNKTVKLENTVKEIAFASAPISFAGAEDPDFVPTDSVTNAEITGGYSIVATRFVLPTNVTDKDIEYGMLISKTVSGEELTAETCTKVAKAIKNFNGAYGILFYGNMVTGDTYYVRPYIKYDDTYTYGAASSFVFNAR